MAFDDFEEERRSVLHVFGEELQQVPVVVKINENAQLLKLKTPQSGSNARHRTFISSFSYGPPNTGTCYEMELSVLPSVHPSVPSRPGP